MGSNIAYPHLERQLCWVSVCPNITGTLFYAGGSGLSVSGAFYANGRQFGYYHSESGTQYSKAALDASKVSSIYAGSQVVQPNAAQILIIIKV